MCYSAPTFTGSRQNQPHINEFIIKGSPLSFHCQFDLLLKWLKSSVCNHPLERKKSLLRRTSCSFRWICGGWKKGGSAACFEVQVADVLIGVRLLPPSAIKPQHLYQPHYSPDNRRLKLWCGIIMSWGGLWECWLSPGTFLLLCEVILVQCCHFRLIWTEK